MKFLAFNNGYCVSDIKYVNKKLKSKKIKFPATFFYLEIEGIKLLFDTGYSKSLSNSSNIFEKLYSILTKVFCIKDADEVLLENNINPNEIQYIIMSHFHPDHYGSLNKFPNASIICSNEASILLSSSDIIKIRNLVLKNLIPNDVEKRILKIENFTKEEMYENRFYNILNLNEIYAFHLEGHAIGHIGIYLKTLRKLIIFDAVWSKDNLEGMQPSKLVKNMVSHSVKEYDKSINKINDLISLLEEDVKDKIEIIIAHDEKFLRSPYEF